MKKSTTRFLAILLALIILPVPEALAVEQQWILDPTTPRDAPSVRCIINCSDGAIYASVTGDGVWKYDNNSWSNINTGLSENAKYVTVLIEGNDGELYAGTSDGVWRYDGIKWESLNNGLSNMALNINTLVQTHDGALYIGTYNGFHKYEGTRWQKIDDSVRGGYQVLSLLESSDGVLYVGSVNQVWRYDGTNWEDINNGTFGFSHTMILSLLETSDGILYVATDGEGVWRYDGKAWSNVSGGMSESALYIYTLFENRDGILYVGTQDRVWKYDSKIWSKISNEFTADARFVYALAADKNGTLYTGTDDGVWQYDGKVWRNISEGFTGIVKGVGALLKAADGTLYAYERWNIWKNDGNEWADISIDSMKRTFSFFMLSRDGALYAAADGGIYKYSGSKWSKISDEIIYGMMSPMIESKDGTIYASADYGVWKYDGTSWTSFNNGFSKSGVIIMSLLEASDGTLYASTSSDGLWRHNGTEWICIKDDIPYGTFISCMIETADETIYIGDIDDYVYNTGEVTDGDVWRLDGESWIKMSDGLSSQTNHIYSIFESKNGTLYICTNSGLWKWDEKEWVNIFSDSCGSLIEADDGTFYLGTFDGIYYVNPNGMKNPFADISEDDWMNGGVQFVVKSGLFAGTSATTFKPDTTMTRGMLATVLWRAAGKPEPSRSGAFTDLTADWYLDAVNWAAGEGVVNGVGDGLFMPDDMMTREQLVTILYRYIGSPDIDMTLSFIDAALVSEWAHDAIKWAYEQDILVSTGNRIEPQAFITRKEAAAMLYKLLS